jgi:hypothetical protein
MVPKLLFVLLNLAGLAMGLYKLGECARAAAFVAHFSQIGVYRHNGLATFDFCGLARAADCAHPG